MKKFNIGVQLYSVRNELMEDMDKALCEIKEMGYDYVQFAEFLGKSASEIKALADKHGFLDRFELIESVERLTPDVFRAVKGSTKPLCANVDMYSGLIYRMLGIPGELYTPLFASARVAGWCAHRIEEILTGCKIMRPAYKTPYHVKDYLPINQR